LEGVCWNAWSTGKIKKKWIALKENMFVYWLIYGFKARTAGCWSWKEEQISDGIDVYFQHLPESSSVLEHNSTADKDIDS
jgi:hypothetical protein